LEQRDSGMMNSDRYFCPFCGGQRVEIIEYERSKYKLSYEPRKIQINCPKQNNCVLSYLIKNLR
jgi:hypothetical protein